MKPQLSGCTISPINSAYVCICALLNLQVFVLCWAHGLYDAILHVYNRGMKDYTTPLEELLALLTRAVTSGKQLSDDHVTLGNKILVYIRYIYLLFFFGRETGAGYVGS